MKAMAGSIGQVKSGAEFGGGGRPVGCRKRLQHGGFHIIFMANVHDIMGVSNTGTIYTGVGGDWFEVNAVPPFLRCD